VFNLVEINDILLLEYMKSIDGIKKYAYKMHFVRKKIPEPEIRLGKWEIQS